jgi:hypothetical protein
MVRTHLHISPDQGIEARLSRLVIDTWISQLRQTSKRRPDDTKCEATAVCFHGLTTLATTFLIHADTVTLL